MKKRLRQLLVDKICQATGGPCICLGREMLVAHKRLGIDGADWQAAITHLIGVLDSFQVSDDLQQEMLRLLNSIKTGRM